MKETIEKAKAEDPALLRQELAEQRGAVRILEHELQQMRAAADKVRAVSITKVPVLAFNDSGVKRLEHSLARLDVYADRMEKGWARVLAAAGELTAQLQAAVKRTVVPLGAIPPGTLVEATHGFAPIPPRGTYAVRATSAALHDPTLDRLGPSRQRVGGSKLTGPERKILTALAQHGACAVDKLAALVGYHRRSKGFTNPLGFCRSRGWLADVGDCVVLTSHGRQALGDWTPLPTGRALLAYWMERLGGPERKILASLAQVAPRPLTREQLAHGAEYHPRSKGFTNPLGRLRTLGLVEGRETIRLAAHLS